MQREKIIRLLNSYQSSLQAEINPTGFDHQTAFLLGICHMQLNEPAEAFKYFNQSCATMFTAPMFWSMSNQPNWLTDICVLSGREDLYPQMMDELKSFERQKGISLVLVYSYGLLELLSPSGYDLAKGINRLVSKPKIKDMYAIGSALQAIVDSDQPLLISSMEKLLKAHEGQAKYGGLRWTAEGLVCMPAMSLSIAAQQRGLRVEIENDYLPLNYLRFLGKA